MPHLARWGTAQHQSTKCAPRWAFSFFAISYLLSSVCFAMSSRHVFFSLAKRWRLLDILICCLLQHFGLCLNSCSLFFSLLSSSITDTIFMTIVFLHLSLFCSSRLAKYFCLAPSADMSSSLVICSLHTPPTDLMESTSHLCAIKDCSFSVLFPHQLLCSTKKPSPHMPLRGTFLFQGSAFLRPSDFSVCQVLPLLQIQW